jgi:uncharacterized protein DUF6438/ankyrin repeat protein
MTLRFLCVVPLGGLLLNAQQAAGRRRAGDGIVPLEPRVQTEGCPTEAAATPPAQPVAPGDFVQLQRTICFGSCPAYTVKIRADGEVEWRGEASVSLHGETRDRSDPDQARSLIEKFRAAGFWGLCASYSRGITDMPTFLTTVGIAGQEKRVSDYADGAPAWLRDLDRELDALADTHRWIHGEPRAESLGGNLGFDARGPKPGLTPLMQAAAKGDLDEMRRLLAGRADPNERDSSGWTPLMYATQAQTADAIRILLQAGASPNAQSYTGQTALMAAAIVFYVPEEKIQALLDAGARKDPRDSKGLTALDYMEQRARGSGDPRYEKLRPMLQ